MMPSKTLADGYQVPVKIPGIHPATYSEQLIMPLSDFVRAASFSVSRPLVLDPFAGLGHKLSRICALATCLGSTPVPIGVEIEHGYFQAGSVHPCVLLGDSRRLPFDDESIDIGLTSPSYPNGVSDNFHSRPEDTSLRHHYMARLRYHVGADYEATDGNAGAMNPRRSPKALEAFYDIHRAVWAEMFRVLKRGSHFIINTKDPLSIPFRMHTVEQLESAGFFFYHHTAIDVKGLNHGDNRDNKLSFEDITVFRKP